MFETREKVPPASPDERYETLLDHIVRFGLTKKNFTDGMLVVGSGDMSFAYMAQQAGLASPGSIVGIEMYPDDYSMAGSHFLDALLDTQGIGKTERMSLYRGDVRDMSQVPDESFKLVISHQAPPAVYYGWLKGGSRGRRRSGKYSARYNQEASPENAPDAIYRSLREMLRVATSDGEVRIWPMPYLTKKAAKVDRRFQEHMDAALKKLHGEYNFVQRKLPTGDKTTGIYCLCLKKRVKKTGTIA